MMSKMFLSAFLLIFVLGFVPVSTAATGPMDQVRVTVDAVIETLKDKSLPKDVMRERIRSLIREKFDFRAMSQGTLAANWKKASEEERTRFIELFSQLLEGTYIGRIEAYSDERIEYVKEKVQDKRALVDTIIVTNVDIPVQYKLRRKGEEWRVYDVVIEGVSLIRNYRSSYSEIVRKEGLDGLLVKMKNKINELRSLKGNEQTE